MPYEILDNEFGHVGSGIMVGNIDDILIKDNTGIGGSTGMKIGTGMKLFGDYFGIYALNCENAQILDNHVASSTTNKCEIDHIGLKVANCNGGLTQCNETSGVGSGIKYVGTTIPRPIIRSNIMNEAMYQFHLDASPLGLGVLGSPPSLTRPNSLKTWDNKWTSDRCEGVGSGGFHTYSENSNLSGGQTKFIVRDLGLPYDPVYHGVNSAPSVQCNDDSYTNYQSIATCPNETGPGPAEPNDEDVQRALKIVREEDEWTYFEQELNWQADYLYYRWAQRADSILEVDTLSELQDYLEYLTDSTSIGQLMAIEDSIGLLDTSSNVSSKIENIMEAIVVMEGQNEMEANYLKYYYLYLDHYGELIEDYDSTAIDTLMDMATQCIVSGGYPVYLARVMLMDLLDTNLVFQDTCDFSTEEERRGREIDSKNNSFTY